MLRAVAAGQYPSHPRRSCSAARIVSIAPLTCRQPMAPIEWPPTNAPFTRRTYLTSGKPYPSNGRRNWLRHRHTPPRERGRPQPSPLSKLMAPSLSPRPQIRKWCPPAVGLAETLLQHSNGEENREFSAVSSVVAEQTRSQSFALPAQRQRPARGAVSAVLSWRAFCQGLGWRLSTQSNGHINGAEKHHLVPSLVVLERKECLIYGLGPRATRGLVGLVAL